MRITSLSIKNIHHSFNGVSVLDIDSLNIYQGEKVALLGPSGAGKTTLLNILSGNLTPLKGTVLVKNTPLKNYKNNKLLAKDIGILRQQFDLIYESTSISNVLFGNFNRWSFIQSLFSIFTSGEKNKAREILQTVGLLHKESSLTKNLSGGEQQRVAISRLIMQSPTIVLCDEPVSSLDPKKSNEILSLLCETLYSEDKTMVSTLHSVDMAKKHFDRIIGLKNGAIFIDVPANMFDTKKIRELYDD